MQAHACAAVVNFAENCDQDVVAPYLDGLISKLLMLLQTGKRNVQVGGGPQGRLSNSEGLSIVFLGNGRAVA